MRCLSGRLPWFESLTRGSRHEVSAIWAQLSSRHSSSNEKFHKKTRTQHRQQKRRPICQEYQCELIWEDQVSDHTQDQSVPHVLLLLCLETVAQWQHGIDCNTTDCLNSAQHLQPRGLGRRPPPLMVARQIKKKKKREKWKNPKK